MRAIVQDRYGSADALRVDQVERPEVQPDEVLVRVAGAGVDRGVWHLMTGLPYPTRLAFGLRRPRQRVPGLDLAGTVEHVGDAVTRFAEGDVVFGSGTGTYAEFARAPEDSLAAVPAGLDPVDAAALATSGSTALQAVETQARVEPGQHVLVLGASGGVGTYTTQIAVALGATVTGVASTAKLDVVRDLGAHHVVDHRSADALGKADVYDVIIDTGGNRSLRDLRHALTPTGTLVIVGGEGGGRVLGGLDRQARAMLRSRFSRQRLTTFVATVDVSSLDRLADLVEQGALRPVVDRRFALEEAPNAVRYLEAGRVRGKVVLDVGAESSAGPAAGRSA